MAYVVIAIGLYLIASISKWIINFSRLKKTQMYLDEYTRWLMSGDSKIDLLERQETVKRLVTLAGKGDVKVAATQPIGYGQIANMTVNPFSAFPNRLENVALITFQVLKSCIGIYRVRCYEGFNPFYWLKLLIFLPRTVFIYLGINGDSLITKIANILWWTGTSVVSGVLIKENSKKINDFILNLLK